MAVVSGSSPGGVSTLDLERIVEGAIQSIDIAHARIGVLGMRVYVTPATNIDGGSDLTLLQANDHVSISGYFGAGRDLIATAILREPSSNTFLLRGILQLGAGGNVQVGGQTVGDLASLTAIGFPAAPANGDAVLVTGNVSGGTPSARSMQYIGGAWAEGTEDIRMLTGLVTRRSHPSDLEIEGREIDCALYPCSELNIAGSGARVGITRVGDVRLVDTATPLNPPLGGLTVSGPIDAIDSANDSLTVLGFAVQRVPMTVVADDAGMPSQLADIRAGDSITVRGAPVGNVIVAGSITPTDVEPTVSFLSRSPYVTVEDSTITVAGQPISIDATTTYEKYSTCFDTPSFTSFLTRVTMNVSRTDTGSLFAHHVKLSKIMRPCP